MFSKNFFQYYIQYKFFFIIFQFFYIYLKNRHIFFKLYNLYYTFFKNIADDTDRYKSLYFVKMIYHSKHYKSFINNSVKSIFHNYKT